LQRNPIRAIDSKDSNIQEIFKKASDISDFLKKEEKESFERTIKSLKDLKIDFNLNKNLVRGLDYYTGTVFEFTVDGLGAQNAVIGGGRYDNLIKDLGGRDLPAIGFALGIDRLAEIINVTTRKKDIFIGSVDDDSINFAQYIGNKLRENIKGLVVENYLGNANVAKQLKKANSQGFKFAIIVGQEEQNTNSFKLKNLLDGSENTLNEIELVEFLNG
jgi:histidyl-tRNA synthetase